MARQEWHRTTELKKGDEKVIYQWKVEGVYKVSANDAGRELERIQSTKGLTAQNVVDESRDERAVLHGCFEWNDNIAAEKWRCEQARRIITCISIKDEETDTEPVRAFVSIKQDSTYQPIQTVISDKEMRKRLLELAKREVEDFKKKYSVLADVSPIKEIFEVTSVS